ncbi:hypothetical protein FRB99_006727 [Tulasnella sp. 403]|nr:hypothetical protein FRB99_006727 [Tulasnella sp. 403]
MTVPSVFTIFEELRTNSDNASTQSLSSPEDYLRAANIALERASYTLAVQHASSTLRLEESRRGDILRGLMVRSRAYKQLGRSEEAERDSIAMTAIDGQTDADTTSGPKEVPSVVNGEIGESQVALCEPSGNTAESSEETIKIEEPMGSPVSQDRPVQEPCGLPYELWAVIASYLPKWSMRSWLSISRMHHAVALPIVFRALRLRLGGLFANFTYGIGFRFEESLANRRSKDLLLFLATNQEFAACVREMAIEGWKKAYEHLIPELMLALQSLTELRSLSWTSAWEPSPEILQCIKDHLPNLEQISLGDMAGSLEPLVGRRGLKSIEYWHTTRLLAVPQEQISEFLENNSHTLETLKLGPCGWLDPWVPAENILRRLRHLYLWVFPLTQEHLNAVLSSDSLIETLVIKSSPEWSFAPATVFKLQRRGLPHLRRLCIQLSDNYSYDIGLFNGIGDFIKGRECLEVLAVQDFGSANPARITSSGFVHGIASLQNLKDLKLQLVTLRRPGMDSLLQSLPQSLERIHIGARVIGTKEIEASIHMNNWTISKLTVKLRLCQLEIARQLSRLSRLRELSLAIGDLCSFSKGHVRTLVTELAKETANVEVVVIHKTEYLVCRAKGGFDVRVCEVEEDGDDWLRRWPLGDHSG